MSRRTLLVLAHPRSDSLTAQVADRVRRRLEAGGGSVDLLDLYAEGFDPRLTTADEPDWTDREKEYSPEVRAHMRRIEEADDLIVVFPVWWYAPPAVLKGWIDRVWNYGFAYGRSRPRLAAKRMLWMALAGGPQASALTDALELQLTRGVSEFCGIGRTAFRFLFGTELSGVPENLRADRARAVFAEAEAAVSAFTGLPEAPAPCGSRPDPTAAARVHRAGLCPGPQYGSSTVTYGSSARRKSAASNMAPAEATPVVRVRPVRIRWTASTARGAVTA